jgi:predicted dehydrogenase
MKIDHTRCGRPLGFAVVGAGYWGANLVRNLATHPDTELRWICDLDEARAKDLARLAPEARVTTTLDDVLDDDRTAAVAVATPAATHYDVAASCLGGGRHVLVEKPLATNAAHAAGLGALAALQDRVLMCDHTYCYAPAALRIRELVRGHHLGEVLYVDSVRVNLGLVQPDVDVFWDLAPHDLSVFDFILPGGLRPEGVSAHGADPLRAGKACVGYLTLPLAGGAIAHVHVNWLSPTKIRHMVVGGSRKTVVWDDLNPQQRLSVYDRGVALEVSTADEALATKRTVNVSYRLGDMHAPVLPEREALAVMVEEYAAAITEGRAALTDGRSGLRVLSVLEAASESQRRAGAMAPVAMPLESQLPQPVSVGAGGAW